MECSHVTSAATLSAEDIRKIRPRNWCCVVCRSHKKSWICLKCGEIGCGRYVNGHAKKHAEENPEHCLCMDQSLTVFCYRCDEFVVNENEVIAAMRAQIRRHSRKMSSSSPSSEDGDKERSLPPPKKLVKMENGGYTCPVRTSGLQNLGNTCFMNSILQSLSNIEQFYGYFSKLPSLQRPAESSTQCPAESSTQHNYPTRRNSLEEVSLVEEVRKVSCALWEDGDSSLSPDSLFSIVWRLVPQFRGYQQQDAHEFMRYLLDKLHTELLTGLAGLNGSGGSNGTSTSAGTIVSQVFGGTLQSDVRCLSCHTNSRKYDPILDVSLDIPDRFISRKKDRTLKCGILDCLASYTGLETLEEAEWYYCHRCKTRKPSTKRLFLHTLPNVLCIHLKRFRFNSFVRTKVSIPVSFPLSGLDVAEFMVSSSDARKQGSVYDLAAVVVHHGSGVSSGHYTAYAFSPKSGVWYHFDDSTVTETTPKRVESCRAYILFYIRRDASNGRCYHTPTGVK